MCYFLSVDMFYNWFGIKIDQLFPSCFTILSNLVELKLVLCQLLDFENCNYDLQNLIQFWSHFPFLKILNLRQNDLQGFSFFVIKTTTTCFDSLLKFMITQNYLLSF